MTQQEIDGQIEWFTDLRKAIESDDKESALRVIDAAIKTLQREGTNG